MRRTKPLAVVAGAALFALAACGGSGGSGEKNPSSTRTFTKEGEVTKDATRQGPAPDISGASSGGTITVYLPGDPGPDSMDPTGGWSVTGNSIQQALTSRSLTQYSRDPKTGQMVLVPDLATDLGSHNDDFTEWSFTIRDDATWEDGSPVTPEQVAWGIQRSMDSDTFPAGAGTEYSQTYFEGAGEYKGPYTEPKAKWNGVTVDGQKITIHMAKTFPDMDYWGAFMAMGPAPLGKASQPPDYGKHIMSNGPYKVESFRPNEELTLVKNDQWDPASDPARHQYADKWVFKFNQDQSKVDQIMLSDNTESQTSLSTSLGSNNYEKANTQMGDRLVQQSDQCVSYLSPDYTKITDINVRKALAYAYPYQDMWLATGEVPGVTRVPANSIMPPGMAGKHEYFVDGEQFTYSPDKAKALLAKAGYANKPYPITMVYYEPDPLAVAGQKVFEKGMAEAGFKVKGIPVQTSPYNVWLNPDDKTNKQLNLRGVNWCSDWPSALTMLPPLLRTGAAYNTAQFSEKSVDDRMNAIPSLPLDQQADAWGSLDEEIETKYFPIIPTAFRNDLFVFGSKIGNPAGDGQIGAPNYKDLYVQQ
ncbi:ABC transporter substrate-binding protein [Nocardioides panaciterrulae]|uniref:Peptide/nickel transport system substrate-binding protein n=1 Tax=Nocardioides panaciterrulae TaxID=661492 RepID=A0A7Y9E6X3_9ACTN|nr:ABC transporter substrate-binding protein [Nocardioides panaciterrulae]NYD42092.1 peptide/nickel transport system substrate-binding protein [Nocardioides panaciterrulae]